MGYWIHIDDGGGGAEGVGEFLLIVLFIIVGFAVGIKALAGAVDAAAEKSGLPATVTAKIDNWPENTNHEKTDLVLHVKSADSSAKEYQASFSKKGTAKVKTGPGSYVVSVGTSDYQYVLGKCEAKRMRSYDFSYNGWFDALDTTELNEKEGKTLVVWVYSGVNDENYYKPIENSDVSVSVRKSDGNMADMTEEEADNIYSADVTDGYWTMTVSANGYETQTREMIVDDDAKAYFTFFNLSKEDD